MLFPPFLYKKQNDSIIPGQFIRALVRQNDQFVLEQLRVYADKTIAGANILSNLPTDRLYKHVSKFLPNIDKNNLSGLGSGSDENINAIPFEDFKFLIRKNLVTQKYKGAVKIEFWDAPLTEEFYIVEIDMKIDNDDFIKSILDVFCVLKNKETSLRKCMNALCEFLQAPKVKKELYRKKLQVSYLNVPKYQRGDIYPLSIDLEGKKPIEDIIFKRDSSADNYEEFVKVYGDDYFENKYK